MITLRPGRAAVALALATAFLTLFAAGASAQATRTWVSGVGDDVNPCSRTAPCKTWAGAISKTAAGGEMDALDSGGFGSVNVTKALTIDGAGTNASILNSGTYGLNVNAPADADVVIRNLSINGGGGCGGITGTHGINILQARSVKIEDVRIQNQQTTGIRIAPSAATTKVTVNRADISSICGAGIQVAPTAGQTASVIVRDSTVSDSGSGLTAADGASVFLTGSALFGNATGMATSGSGTITDMDDNVVKGNGTDGSPTTVEARVDPTPGPAGPTGAQGAAGAPGAQGPTGPLATELIVAVSSSAMRKRAGAPVTVAYAATARGATTLTVKRGKRTVATVRKTAKKGRNTISWNGRTAGKRAKAGSYRLSLRTRGADGQVGTADATLRLR